MKKPEYRSLLQMVLDEAEFAQFNGIAIRHFHAQQVCYTSSPASGTLEKGRWRPKYVRKIVRRIFELPFSVNTPPLHHRVIRLSIDSVDSVQLRHLVMGSFRLVVDLMQIKAIADSTRIYVCIWVSPAAAEIVASSIKRALPGTHFDQLDSHKAAQGRQL